MADQQFITVDIPDVGPIDFPASMTPDQINAAAKRLYDDAQTTKRQHTLRTGVTAGQATGAALATGRAVAPAVGKVAAEIATNPLAAERAGKLAITALAAKTGLGFSKEAAALGGLLGMSENFGAGEFLGRRVIGPAAARVGRITGQLRSDYLDPNLPAKLKLEADAVRDLQLARHMNAPEPVTAEIAQDAEKILANRAAKFTSSMPRVVRAVRGVSRLADPISLGLAQGELLQELDSPESMERIKQLQQMSIRDRILATLQDMNPFAQDE